MKKQTDNDFTHQRIRIKNEFRRKTRKTTDKMFKSSKIVRVFSRIQVIAPEVLDIFNNDSYREFILFLTRIRELVIDGKKVIISFKNTYGLKANAVVVLYAHIDFLQRITGKKDVIAITGCKTSQANSWFKGAGIWDLVGFQPDFTDALLPIVSAVAGTQENSNKIREVLTFIKKEIYAGKISEKEGMRLYVAITESISNVGLHAYPVDTEVDYAHFVSIAGKRWWTLARKIEDQLFLIIYDMGEGIPCSLVKRDFFSLIQQRFAPKSDADKIQSALKYGETRMGSNKHGKGLPDMKSYVLDNPMGELHIFSGMGRFFYKTKENQEEKFNLPFSIGGTLIQWNILLKSD